MILTCVSIRNVQIAHMNSVLERLFRPITQLTMARGLRFADVSESLRRATYHAAVDQEAGKVTDSKIAVMTGLQRRDVARLRDGAPPKRVGRPDVLSQIVSLWLADRLYAGRPIRRRGEAPSFEALAKGVRRDVHPKSLLDPLVEAGTVRLEGDMVVLVTRAHVPRQGDAAQLDWLADNAADHLSAAVQNVTGSSGHMDQAVAYHGLTPDAVAELEALWRSRLGPAIEEVNARALELQDQEAGSMRFRAGAYFYKEAAE